MSQEFLPDHYPAEKDKTGGTAAAGAPIADDTPLLVGVGDPSGRLFFGPPFFIMLAVGLLSLCIIDAVRPFNVVHQSWSGPNMHGSESRRRYTPQAAFILPATYAEPSPIHLQDKDKGEGLSAPGAFTSNGTFNLTRQPRSLIVTFIGDIPGEVVISRQANVSSYSHVFVESSWYGDGPAAGAVRMIPYHSYGTAELMINGTGFNGSHVVHVVLPSSPALPMRYLDVKSETRVGITVDASDTAGIASEVFAIAVGDVRLPSLPYEHLTVQTIEGAISGTFNVSGGLRLQTVTGDIDATVCVPPNAETIPTTNPAIGTMPHSIPSYLRIPFSTVARVVCEGNPRPHIHAESTTGSVHLTVDKPSTQSALVVAESSTGTVQVVQRAFEGRFASHTDIGKIYVDADIKVLNITRDDTSLSGRSLFGNFWPVAEEEAASPHPCDLQHGLPNQIMARTNIGDIVLSF